MSSANSETNPQANAAIHTPYGKEHPTALSTPKIERELVHQRRITLNGYVRNDGLFDIEAELTDHKTYPFPSDFRGEVTPDLPVHHMILRITITKERVITAAEAITVTGPYAICPKANEVFDELVGLKISPGWRRQVQAAIGGRHGCTHTSPNCLAQLPPSPIRQCMAKMRANAGPTLNSPMLTSKANEAIWPIVVLAMLMIGIRNRAIEPNSIA